MLMSDDCDTQDNGMDSNLQQIVLGYLVKYSEAFVLLFPKKHPVQGQVILDRVGLGTMRGCYSLVLQTGWLCKISRQRHAKHRRAYKHKAHLLVTLLVTNFDMRGEVPNKIP